MTHTSTVISLSDSRTHLHIHTWANSWPQTKNIISFFVGEIRNTLFKDIQSRFSCNRNMIFLFSITSLLSSIILHIPGLVLFPPCSARYDCCTFFLFFYNLKTTNCLWSIKVLPALDQADKHVVIPAVGKIHWNKCIKLLIVVGGLCIHWRVLQPQHYTQRP